MKAKEIYHKLKKIVRPIHRHDEQLKSIAMWIEQKFKPKEDSTNYPSLCLGTRLDNGQPIIGNLIGIGSRTFIFETISSSMYEKLESNDKVAIHKVLGRRVIEVHPDSIETATGYRSKQVNMNITDCKD